MSQFVRLFLFAILLVGFPSTARADALKAFAALNSMFVVSLGAIQPIFATYGHKAIEREDPNGAPNDSLRNDLVAAKVGGAFQALSFLSAVTAASAMKDVRMAVPVTAAFGSLWAIVGLVGSVDAYTRENDHFYNFWSIDSQTGIGTFNLNKEGVSHEEFPIIVGTSIGSVFFSLLATGLYMGVANRGGGNDRSPV